ncbi:MAG: hypothetical protein ACWGPS_03575, partial [Candidatus Promineifilaceae bacterium]
LRHRMDGRLAIVYHDQVLGLLQPAQLGPPRLEVFEPAPQHLAPRSRPTPSPANGSPAAPPRTYAKPDYNHPWRREGRAFYRQRQLKQEKQQQQD